ncbi:MAG: bifunctional phosphopantothenoylcysteine decarboxylase/phosphopantothenate--cysteine ligase CoaBC [candidate division KSB1 bacterium]|nr:bifunctional phosphopantothenoylcysteine decarboxylase/phosphopantothenate--cysteine ligase CoaBC [candidate division KSB1 bacterium]MDZ7358347.1 bifunctional phosphopantothenoylcysteine decarboxylase/phosphopantothenate--cysteine ligase CoaBC [candidate division KSB1 bacterium]MDZ7399148.1 bifunctional phosphopantothenoylcysteine decarboxylase/phosphopantothenate--cysteine ligase CoaBC [candidate division KSB1 bacterium]
MLSGAKILVGVTGGIAAYKTAELIRELKRHGAVVRVVMTRAATEFVTPLTFATLSEHPVLSEMFGSQDAGAGTIHIEAARWADVIVICPATANTIGKIAVGLADNLLTTLVMATTSPVIFCPAMNKEMYQNTIVQQNIDQLVKKGYHIVPPGSGELACGEIGWGRLADIPAIIDKIKMVVLGTHRLAGKKILVTAGRTEEPLDPVRFITNRSTGKMGFAIAEMAALNGAEVTLISGPNQLRAPVFVNYVSVQTADQMADAVLGAASQQDVIIMAAAVADFKPEQYSLQKIKKSDIAGSLRLVRTRDILKELGRTKQNQILVGFAVETEHELEHAREKLIEKRLDLIVVNNPLLPGAGFGTDTNRVTLLDAAGGSEELPLMTKHQVAQQILARVIRMIEVRK